MQGINHHNHSGSDSRSYRDVLQSGSGSSAIGQNDHMNRLKASLSSIMRKHPEGLSLAQVRRSCPLLHDPEVIAGFASSKQLLAALTDVVQLQGFGVQTRVYPAAGAQAQT